MKVVLELSPTTFQKRLTSHFQAALREFSSPEGSEFSHQKKNLELFAFQPRTSTITSYFMYLVSSLGICKALVTWAGGRQIFDTLTSPALFLSKPTMQVKTLR